MFNFLKSKLSRVKAALSKTRTILGHRLRGLFKEPWSAETMDELEEIFFEADLGSEASLDFTEMLQEFFKTTPNPSEKEIFEKIGDHALKIFDTPKRAANKGCPTVTLVVGVNGAGKTTSIAKLATHYIQSGESVLLAAGDTFRAAAVEQLTIWAERAGAMIVKHQDGADSSAVAFDALTSAKAKGIDRVIIDTAGRLQNRDDLMAELEKIVRVIQKVVPEAPHETLLVVDATTGQNAVDQAEVFNRYTPLTGIVLTKLDGSAKGGVALSITKKLGIPITWIGIGEKADDLMPFDAKTFVDALFDKE